MSSPIPPGRLSCALSFLSGLCLALSPLQGQRPMPERPAPAPAPPPSPRSDPPQPRSEPSHPRSDPGRNPDEGRGGPVRPERNEPSSGRPSADPAHRPDEGHGGPVRHDPANPSGRSHHPHRRCVTQPNDAFWTSYDIFKEIQRMARRGNIKVLKVRDDADGLQGAALYPEGWAAYGFLVPPRGKVQVELSHPMQAWIRLQFCNKWGREEEGMLQNRGVPANLAPCYLNPTDEVKAVYLIVDDPALVSGDGNPYTLRITRSWEPGSFDFKGATLADGIWKERP